MHRIRIDGEIYEIYRVSTGGYLPMVCDGHKEWHIVRNHAEAARATLRYWQEMDAKEVVAMIGADAIVRMWSDGTTLEEWVGDLSDAEQWASYDGSESEVQPPTPAEWARAALISQLRGGDAFEEGDLAGVRVGETTYWLMAEEEGELGTRFTTVPEGFATAGTLDDVKQALDDETFLFCAGWDALVEELGFTPTIAYRHN